MGPAKSQSKAAVSNRDEADGPNTVGRLIMVGMKAVLVIRHDPYTKAPYTLCIYPKMTIRVQKPRVFALYKLSDDVRAEGQRHFQLTCEGEPGYESWREEAEGIMVRSADITKADVEHLGKCRFVVKHGVGVDRLAMDALKNKGITVMNTAGVNANAVAEVALAHILALSKNLPFIDRSIRAGAVVTKADGGSTGYQLAGKTLGLIGGGNIGLALGRMFSAAFNGKILVYDPYLSPAARKLWEAQVPTFTVVDDRETLYKTSDIVSLHVPLLDSTRGMIGAKQLGLMKRNAIIINSARGELIDESALIDALESGQILGAGLDAWEHEPPTLERYERLISHPRVTSTPHIGAACLDIIDQTARSVIDHLVEAFAGKPRDVL